MDDLNFLAELLSISSPSGNESRVAKFLEEKMGALGFRVWRDKAGNVIGEIGDPNAKTTGVLLGHMDTVPGQIPVHLKQGRLFGRGAVDAKGPLAAFVLAAARAGPKLVGVRVLVIGAVEEEARSRGARYLAYTLPSPSWAIIGEPSGWDGITLGYKGVLTMQYRRWRPACHTSFPQPTPAEEAVRFWNQLSAYAAGVNSGRARGFHTLDPVLNTIRTFNDGLYEGVEMGLSLRLPPGSDPGALRTAVLGLANGAPVSFPYLEHPFVAEKNTPLVRAFLRAIRTVGGQPRFKLKTGTSDMNVVGRAFGCPILAYGPGDSTLDHSPNEHIEIEEFRRGLDVLILALRNCGESVLAD